jgi:hypothetical protein
VGLAINDFAAGVEFFKTLPSIDDPFLLRGPDFGLPTEMSPEQWMSSLKQQVAAQYLVLKENPGMNGFAAAFTAPMTITGSAKVYTIYTSKEVFNGQVIIKFSTDGKMLIIGKLNFAGDSISVSSRLYADMSRVSQGNVVVLFLADVPDQARLLTMYGSLKTGLRDANGNDVPVTVISEAPAQPTPTLAGPRTGDNVSLAEINERGFIDVPFTVPDGHRLDEASILDVQPEFDVSVTGGAAGDYVKLDETQPPLLIDANTHTYRYWVRGRVSAGATVSITYLEGKWATFDATGKSVGCAATSQTVANAVNTIGTGYLDVLLTPTANQQVDAVSVNGDEIMLPGGLAVSNMFGPTRLTGTNIFRFYVTGEFALGPVTIDLPADKWSDTAGPNIASVGSFTVVQPEASVATPFDSTPAGSTSVDVTTANKAVGADNKLYIDVTFAATPGATLDYASIMDSQAEFSDRDHERGALTFVAR